MKNLTYWTYGWLLKECKENYINYFTDGGGWLLCFVLMIGAALIASAIYYYGIATKVNSATKENYLWTWVFGYLVLFFFTPLIFQLVHRDSGCNIWDFWVLFLYIGLLNAIYYTIVYQVFSYIFCSTPWTKANNINLFTVFK